MPLLTVSLDHIFLFSFAKKISNFSSRTLQKITENILPGVEGERNFSKPFFKIVTGWQTEKLIAFPILMNCLIYTMFPCANGNPVGWFWRKSCFPPAPDGKRPRAESCWDKHSLAGLTEVQGVGLTLLGPELVLRLFLLLMGLRRQFPTSFPALDCLSQPLARRRGMQLMSLEPPEMRLCPQPCSVTCRESVPCSCSATGKLHQEKAKGLLVP